MQPRSNPPEMPGYRLLTIKGAKPIKDGQALSLEFEESRVGIEVSRDFLSEKAGVASLGTGDQIFIKGKTGNSDADFWGIATVDDIKIAS